MNTEILEILDSNFFDINWYLAKYPDVKIAGLNPIEHYLSNGAKELRDPGPLFDTAWYVKKNPDVIATGLNPLVHFIRYGVNEGRDPSAAAFLQKKVCMPENLVGCLFDYYRILDQDLPDAANSSNCDLVKLKWTDYFLSKGAYSYSFGRINQSLQFILSAVQVNPENENSHAMFQHVFRVYNSNALTIFEKFYARAELLIVHMTCNARLSYAQNSALSFYDKHNRIRNVILIGDDSLPKNKFEFDPLTQILKVPSADSYEALPQKISNFFLFLGLSFLEALVLKVDDNIHCKSIDVLYRDLKETMQKNDYGGYVIPKKPFFLSTFWHLNKCYNPVINFRPDSLLHTSPYAAGPWYWMGSNVVNALSKIVLMHERFFETEIYEDRSVGAALACYDFHPCHFNLIDSGSLEDVIVAGELP